MRIRIHTIALAICASLASAPLFAGTPINETRPLDARGRIDIENVKGRIEVRAWDRNEVRITGTLGEGVEKLVIDGDRQDLEVRVEYPRRMGGWRSDRTGPTTLILQVPLRADLDIESVSGNVTVAAAPGKADVSSVSGDLDLTLNTASAKSESVSGDIGLTGRLNGEVHAETVSGDIHIDSRGERVRRLSTGTVSGDAQVRVGLADGGEIRSETVSGDIHLRLPKALSARVRGESFSGDLDAPGVDVRKEEFGPGKSFEARYGSGNGQIRIESFSGDAMLTLE
jgi:hypothetical protein